MGWAAFGQHDAICKMLVNEFKADPWAKNKHGQTAWILVQDKSHPKWAGIWSNRSDVQESVQFKMVASDSNRTSKVLLKVPTLGKKEDDDEDPEDLVEYVVRPRRPAPPLTLVPRPTPATPPMNLFAFSCGIPRMEPTSLLKSFTIASSDAIFTQSFACLLITSYASDEK